MNPVVSIRILAPFCAFALGLAGCDQSHEGQFDGQEGNKKANATSESANPTKSPETGRGNPFREILPHEEYDRRMKDAASSIESSIHLATDTKHPTTGLKLGRIDEELAAKTGLKEGSILYQRGDWKSWARYLPYTLLRQAPYTAHLIDPDDQEQKVEMNPGPLKAVTSRVYRPDIAYLRNEIGTRDPKWDNHMILAGLAFEQNAELTETAVYHAIEAGYPKDALTDFYEAVFKTMTKEGPEEALNSFFSRFDGTEIPWIYLPPLHSAIVVTGRIDFMQRVADQAGDNCVYNPEVLKQFLAWTDGKISLPEESLLDRAIARRGSSITAIFKSGRRIEVFDSGRRMEGRVVPGPPIEDPLSFTTPAGHNFHVEYTSDDIPQNIHHHLRIKMQANGIDPGWQTKLMIDWAYLYDAKSPAPRNYRFYRMSNKRLLHFSTGTNYYSTVIETAANGLPGLTLEPKNLIFVPFVKNPILPVSIQEDFEKRKDTLAIDPEVMEIDMIRYQNELGVFVNGVCCLHLPTDPRPTVNFDLNVRALGTTATIENQEIWELKN